MVVLPIDARSPAGARNAALRERARGDVVYFLDDDVTIAPDLFARALRVFTEWPAIGVVGGPNLTPSRERPVRALRRARARVAVRIGGRPPPLPRTGALGRADDRALILCNLAIRRSALGERRRSVPEDVVCNEENILLAGLASRGIEMLHDPDLVVYHARRGSVGSFWRQVFRYGRGRWQNTLVPFSLSPMFLVPVAFLLYLLTVPFAHTGSTCRRSPRTRRCSPASRSPRPAARATCACCRSSSCSFRSVTWLRRRLRARARAVAARPSAPTNRLMEATARTV